MVTRIEYDVSQLHDTVVEARRLKASLPKPKMMQQAAIDHLAKRGHVKYPMVPGRPCPDGIFKEYVLRVARTGDARGAVRLPIEMRSKAEYYVPVRIDTPSGSTTETVRLKLSWSGDAWYCSSIPVDRKSLKTRATARRYRFLLLVVPNESTAKAVLKTARQNAKVLSHEMWDIKGMEDVADGWPEPIYLRHNENPWALSGQTSTEYRRFVRTWKSKRRITSRAAIDTSRVSSSA